MKEAHYYEQENNAENINESFIISSPFSIIDSKHKTIQNIFSVSRTSINIMHSVVK